MKEEDDILKEATIMEQNASVDQKRLVAVNRILKNLNDANDAAITD